jgi:hypothetical protein
MFQLFPCLVKVPLIVYALMFYGGGLAALLSIVVLVVSALRKKKGKYFSVWIAVLIVSIVSLFLTTSGLILANEMFGG